MNTGACCEQHFQAFTRQFPVVLITYYLIDFLQRWLIIKALHK